MIGFKQKGNMHINLNQLRSFYLAAKYESIKKAAEALYVTPPAISMQVKKLETWLGFRLLAKDGNSIRLTKDAKIIFKYAEVIFREVEELETKLAQEIRSRKEEILIGSHYIPAKYIMPKLIEQLNVHQPQFTFKVVLDSVPLLMDRILNHELHFVLTASQPPCQRIKNVPLFTEELVLVTRAESKHVNQKEITVDKLKTLPLLLPEQNTSIFHIITEYLDDFGISPCIEMENISADIIKNFLLQDAGAAFLLRFTVKEKLESGELQEIKIKDDAPVATFSLSYLAETNLSQEVQTIISALEKTVFMRSQLV